MQTLTPKEYKIVALRECAPEIIHADTPDKAAAYYRSSITQHPYHNPDVESFYVLMLNTRRRIKGHVLISQGTLDTILVHPREVFRAPIISSSAAIILMHNHPSGDPTPSEGDIKVTRDLVRAGQILKIDVLDHIIIGTAHPDLSARGFCSLRELGYFTGL